MGASMKEFLTTFVHNLKIVVITTVFLCGILAVGGLYLYALNVIIPTNPILGALFLFGIPLLLFIVVLSLNDFRL
jgi:hypothetical protein